jgi:uncharacterized damage-inducible protein DinB
MKIAIHDLLEYIQKSNNSTIDLLVENQASLPSKAIEIYSHMINAHHAWNARILGKKPFFKIWQIHSVEVFSEMNEENYLISKKIIENNELDKMISYKNSHGEAFENTIKDIMFHIINHSSYHRGQVMLLVRNAGLEPIPTDYILTKR